MAACCNSLFSDFVSQFILPIPKALPAQELQDLTQVLICVNATLVDYRSSKKVQARVEELATLSKRVSGRASSGWKKLGYGLLMFACVALVAVGFLATLPLGGAPALLAAIGVATVFPVASWGAFYHSREKGLAKTAGQFRGSLDNIKRGDAQQKPTCSDGPLGIGKTPSSHR